MIKVKKTSNKGFKNIKFACITVSSRNFSANKNLKEIILEKKISFDENENIQLSNALNMLNKTQLSR